MLYNPKWRSEPSIAGFKSWLRQQDLEQRFIYRDCKTCAVGQYLASLGLAWHEVPMAPTLNVYPRVAFARSNSKWFCQGPTFGEVLAVMERLGD